MNRFILYIVIFALFSCGKKSQESKNNANQATKEDFNKVVELKKNDTISIDSTLAHRLSGKEVSKVFTKRKQNLLGISNTVYQAYSYNDESGKYYLLLTDHMKTIDEEKDTLYDNIFAMKVSNKNNQLKKSSSIKDEIDEDWETTIGFWNKYSEISDLDKDGLADLILVYGTKGQDEYVDGRVKIMIYHKKKRITIRHQNSDIKGGRLTKISSKFYTLPTQIQQVIKEKMRLMVKNRHATFSENWETQMTKEATRLEDN